MTLLPNKALPAKKEDSKFTPGTAASYPSHQTSEKVTIGAQPYYNDEDTRPVFGKHNPYDYGVLPVLIVIQNDSGKTIRVQPLEAVWDGPNGDKVEATPAKDVRYLNGPSRPRNLPRPPGMPPKVVGKGPLNTWEIEGRAFAAQVLPPGQSASGFLYFQTGYQKGSSLILSGLREAESGRELLYFEIPIVDK
ncbi:MAG TPA: hypothetical protein VMG35_10945 [Bryobacteraceae bacterium]|nr:hypothetical protein [Bryobacteraceae bacterium]